MDDTIRWIHERTKNCKHNGQETDTKVMWDENYGIGYYFLIGAKPNQVRTNMCGSSGEKTRKRRSMNHHHRLPKAAAGS
jgi:hypothetical protein